MARAGDAREEGAVGNGREHLSILDGKDIGGRGLGHVAERVGHKRVAESLLARLLEPPLEELVGAMTGALDEEAV